MKLLSPSVKKDIEESERIRGLLRMQEQEKEAQRIRIELANAEADFKTTLAKNRTQWVEEEKQHSKRIAEMKKEVAILEDRKANALIPVKMYEKQAKQLLEQAHEALNLAHRREKDAEALTTLLEDKLDSTGQIGQDLARLEASLKSQEEGIKTQKQQVISSTKKLNKEIANFYLIKQAQEAEIQQEKDKIFMEKRSLEAWENKNRETETQLTKLAQQLEDERRTLERAMKRKS